jgi:hypothetical protein
MQKEIQGDTNGNIVCVFMIYKTQYCKAIHTTKMTYRFNIISPKAPMAFVIENKNSFQNVHGVSRNPK